MYKFTFILLLTFSGFTFGQAEGFQFTLGGSVNKFQFQDFETFVDSYNNQFINDPSNAPKSPLKFKSVGFGAEFGLAYHNNRIFASFDAGQSRTLKSKAAFKEGFERIFQFRNWLLDINFGFNLLDPDLSKTKIILFASQTTQATQLHSWLDYGDFKSYGAESRYNGVWTSWKMNITFGLMVQHQITERFGCYANFKYPLYKKKYLGGSFVHSDGFTSGGNAFPADANTSLSVLGGLKEEFRYFRFSFGINYELRSPN